MSKYKIPLDKDQLKVIKEIKKNHRKKKIYYEKK
jgi:hypothetical protein